MDSKAKKMSLKERTIAVILGIVALYAAAAGLWFMSQENAWRMSKKKYAAAREQRMKEDRLIRETSKWNNAYEAERAKMPTFEEDEKGIDTKFLSRMEELCQENAISISRRQPGQEQEVGDVYELPITVNDWEGSLDNLVKFIYALERDEDSMFDLSALSIKPSAAHKGYLKGSFTLTCAYMRNKGFDSKPTKSTGKSSANTNKNK